MGINTSTSVPAKVPYSFVYEELISHVEMIQDQMIEIDRFLTGRWINDKKIQNKLKSRSFTIIDPFGNPLVTRYMDHQLLSKIITNYTKEYLPKYLQPWIGLGRIYESKIVPLTNSELKLTVSNYSDGSQFVTYCLAVVWIITSEEIRCHRLGLIVLPTDNMEKIKRELKERVPLTSIELRLCTTTSSMRPSKLNWDELEDGRTLNDYNLEKESTIHLVLRLRGAMYHIKSGRQDFHKASYDGEEAVKQIFQFKLKDTKHIDQLSLTELQNFVVEGQAVLSNLLHKVHQLPESDHIPNLKKIITSTLDNHDM